MGQLSNDIDGKLDRLEFSPIREELERQLKMLSRKLKALDMGQPCDDDAAGIRRQLIQRFHCISCDRQVGKDVRCILLFSWQLQMAPMIMRPMYILTPWQPTFW